MKKQISYKVVSLVFSIMVLCFAVAFYAVGWDDPGFAPPTGNVDTPLNTGPTGQSKEGGLILNTGGAVNGLIVDQGNVGIGTTTPGNEFNLAKSKSGSRVYMIADNTSDTASSDVTILSRVAGTSAGDPTFATWVTGGSSWTFGADNSNSDAFAISASTDLNVPKLTIETGGNVGIGTPNPSEKLDVVGSIIASGTICDSNGCIGAGGGGGGWISSGAIVHNGAAPLSWTSLDLSAAMGGAKRTMVLLKIVNPGNGATSEITFRNPGDTYTDLGFLGATRFGGGTSGVTLQGSPGNTYFGYLVLETDDSGIVEWRSTVVNNHQVYLVGYVGGGGTISLTGCALTSWSSCGAASNTNLSCGINQVMNGIETIGCSEGGCADVTRCEKTRINCCDMTY